MGGRSPGWGAEYRWECQDCEAWGMPDDPDDPYGVAIRGAKRHADAEGHPVDVVRVSVVVWPEGNEDEEAAGVGPQ